eukprot:14231349-Ditylum_brightwellii.AAC.1
MDIIKNIFEPEYLNGDKEKAIRIDQQLISSTPEFSATSLARKGTTTREISSYTDPPSNSYKAVVFVMLMGGMDSFNMLVPMADCPQKPTMYGEYKTA